MPKKVVRGVVKIIGGELDGMLGYYDEDAEGGCVVYLGAPFASQHILLPKPRLQRATEREEADFEEYFMAYLSPEVRAKMGLTIP